MLERNRPYGAYAWRAVPALTSLVPAWIFALGAVAKFADPTKPLVFIQGSLKVPYPWSRWLILALAVVEIAVAAWLAFNLGRSVWPGIAGLVLIGFFSGLLLAVARMYPGTNPSCPCFGELQPPLGGRSIMGQMKLDALLCGLLFAHVAMVFWGRRGGRQKMSPRTTAELPATVPPITE